ncbi:helix-hairpin-helix domain-containing protein [Imperialibacter roseus]|uniref:Helix-hairpin-helix domain-containing protein n=1 Tax=Imperialibacter roseus TaxID=1324217 RepID=A0ABZ0IST1_9BACT|nr:helix-hairpin-helix domain-containing protein [Imperialibacter roseus]WOK07015.1 helix-hairpin-helix domain-containing protein [Imperialibacter roseus]
MDNKEIISQFRLMASLMELHEENQFKIRGYTGAVFNLEKVDKPIATMTAEEIGALEGIGKSMAANIHQLLEKGTFDALEELRASTPAGVVEMLSIKGIGPKKIRLIWKELEIESLDALQKACEEGRVAGVKGFGEKTQQTILDGLKYRKANVGKLHFSEAEMAANQLIEALKKELGEKVPMSFVGPLRRLLEVIDTLELLVGSLNSDVIIKAIEKSGLGEVSLQQSGPYSIRGHVNEPYITFHIRLCEEKQFTEKLLLYTAAPLHLNQTLAEGAVLRDKLTERAFATEEEAYKHAGLAYIAPELREGSFEIALAQENKLPKLVEMSDLKGILHNHSTYSDGKNTLKEMAVYCKELGYEYLGISDHSRSAFYASGLEANRVKDQQVEIDALNKELAPFRIFKGIESDILPDGSLDYETEVLASFDFIVASVHSVLNMDLQRATTRLLKAIKNPFTTMLGHPTGRLLLERKGYPIDHKTVIDACAEEGVIIEINAHPWRLDLDWRWVHYAIEKGVMLSINPDAHETEGYHDMRYGLLVGRKGGLTKEMTFNALSTAEVAAHFEKRKKRAAEMVKYQQAER